MTPPPPLLDPSAAGFLWRATKLDSFKERAARAGIAVTGFSAGGDGEAATVATRSDDEEEEGTTPPSPPPSSPSLFASLLARAAELTAELDALSQRQANGDCRVPWWADGEYDERSADEANERGLEALRRWKEEEGEEKKKNKTSSSFSSFPSSLAEQALALFTEAARLCPSSAVYSANRAAAALSLAKRNGGGASSCSRGRDNNKSSLLFLSIALEAAGDAVRADDRYARAWSLRGRTLSSLGRFNESFSAYKRAEELEREDGTASKKTRRALEAARAASAAAVAAAAAGDAESDEDIARPALPRQLPPPGSSSYETHREEAGAALDAAERALEAEPGRHEFARARVEALILAGRLTEASEEASALLPGPDRAYLVAEAAWRSGNVERAAGELREFLRSEDDAASEKKKKKKNRRRRHADLARFLERELLPAIELRDHDRALDVSLTCRESAPGLAARLLVERGAERMRRAEEEEEKEGEGEEEKGDDDGGKTGVAGFELAEADAAEALSLVPGHEGALRLAAAAAAAAVATAFARGEVAKNDDDDDDGDDAEAPPAAAAASAAAAPTATSAAAEAADRAFLALRKLQLSSSSSPSTTNGGAEEEVAAAARACLEAERSLNGGRGGCRRHRRRRHRSGDGDDDENPPPPRSSSHSSSSSFHPMDPSVSASAISEALEELRLPRASFPSRGSGVGGGGGGSLSLSASAVRAAFLSRAAECHPDKMEKKSPSLSSPPCFAPSGEEFVRAHGAYKLLMSFVGAAGGS